MRKSCLTADNRKLSTKHRRSCRKNPEKPAIMRKAVQQLVDFKGVTCVFNRRDTRARSLLTIYIGKVGFEHGTHGTFKLRWSRNRSGAPVWSALWTSLGLTCTGLRLHWADSWLVRKQHARSRAAGCKALTVLQPRGRYRGFATPQSIFRPQSDLHFSHPRKAFWANDLLRGQS